MPPPPLSRGRKEQATSSSRCGGHPSVLRGTARKRCLPANKNEGGGAPTGAYALQPRHTDKRYRLPVLRARRAPRMCDVTAVMRFGRARLSALRRGTRQAVTSGSASGRAYRDLQRLAPPQPLLLASSSRPGRSAGEAGSEAARGRSVSLRPQGPHPFRLKEHPRERHPSGPSGAP